MFCPLPLWPDQSDSRRQDEINEVPGLSKCHLGVNASDEALPFIKAADNATGAGTLLPDMMNLQLFCWSAQEQAYASTRAHTRTHVFGNQRKHAYVPSFFFFSARYPGQLIISTVGQCLLEVVSR